MMKGTVSKGLAKLGHALSLLSDEEVPNEAVHILEARNHSAATRIQSYHRMRRSKKQVAALRAKRPPALDLEEEELGIGEVVMDEEEKDGTFYTSVKPVSVPQVRGGAAEFPKLDLEEEKRDSAVHLDTPVHSTPAYGRSPGKAHTGADLTDGAKEEAPPVLPPTVTDISAYFEAQEAKKSSKKKRRASKSGASSSSRRRASAVEPPVILADEKKSSNSRSKRHLALQEEKKEYKVTEDSEANPNAIAGADAVDGEADAKGGSVETDADTAGDAKASSSAIERRSNTKEKTSSAASGGEEVEDKRRGRSRSPHQERNYRGSGRLQTVNETCSFPAPVSVPVSAPDLGSSYLSRLEGERGGFLAADMESIAADRAACRLYIYSLQHDITALQHDITALRSQNHKLHEEVRFSRSPFPFLCLLPSRDGPLYASTCSHHTL